MLAVSLCTRLGGHPACGGSNHMATLSNARAGVSTSRTVGPSHDEASDPERLVGGFARRAPSRVSTRLDSTVLVLVQHPKT